jgi:hypothetical protein
LSTAGLCIQAFRYAELAGEPRGVVDGQRQLASNWAAIGNGWGGMRVKVEL